MRIVEGMSEANVAEEVEAVVVAQVEEEHGTVLGFGLGQELAAFVVAHCVVLLFSLFFLFLILSILLRSRAADIGVVAAV